MLIIIINYKLNKELIRLDYKVLIHCLNQSHALKLDFIA